MLAYTVKQGEFIIDTTCKVSSGSDFLATQYGMILYNSTCMCLQTIGETLKQIDTLTRQQFLGTKYSSTPWRNIFALRNIISHEYAATDPDEIFHIIHNDLLPLLDVIKNIIDDINSGKHDDLLFTIKRT